MMRSLQHMRVVVVTFVVAVFLSGCTSFLAKNSSLQIRTPKEIASFRITDPEPPEIVDKELKCVPPEMQPKVEQWISYFQGKGRPLMERYLSRSTRYVKLMKRIMRQNGLPEDLVYIALIESGFSSRATSRAAAVGYWQFIKGTGRRYGLEINSLVDERRDPILSTQAAAEYFKGLYSVFGSWYLSLASYNVGENRVKREVMNHYTRDFWELARRRRFPKETVNYVPKFVAAKMIAKDPEKYGFSEVDYEVPLEFELIKVDRPVSLKNMAQRMGMEYGDLKLMNPKFRGEIAPIKNSEGDLEIRVPVGQTKVALAAAQSSFVSKVRYIADAGETETYKVRPGDSLYTISRRYRTTVAWLRDINDLKSGKHLRIGMRLQVPDRAGRSIASKRRGRVTIAKVQISRIMKKSEDTEKAASNPEITTAKGTFYIVQAGDTLSSVAEEYDSSIRELRRMNRMGRRSRIMVGMKLKVPKDEGLPAALDDSTIVPIVHTVRAGENLISISKRYKVPVSKIRIANNIKRRNRINAGATLRIPRKVKNSTPAVDSDPKRLPASTNGETSQLEPSTNVRVHIVKRGENLTYIADKYQVSLNSLRKRNHIENGAKLFVGAKLIVPNHESDVAVE